MKQKLEQQPQHGSHHGMRQPQHKAAGCHQFHISTANSPSYCRRQEEQCRDDSQKTFRPNMQEGEGGYAAAHPVRYLPPLQIHKGGGQQQSEKQGALHPTSAGQAAPRPVLVFPAGERLSAGSQTVPTPAGRPITLHCEAVP